MNMIFKENKTLLIGLLAKQKIVVIRPKINFLKDPSTPPLRRVDKAVGPFSKSTLWNGFICDQSPDDLRNLVIRK